MVTAFGKPLERRILLPDDVYVGNQLVEIVNPGWNRIVYWANVTVNPGAAETILLALQTRIPDAAGQGVAIAATAASALGGAAGTLGVAAGPGVAAGWTHDVVATFDGVLPQFLRLLVNVSAAGNWEYSVGIDGHG